MSLATESLEAPWLFLPACVVADRHENADRDENTSVFKIQGSMVTRDIRRLAEEAHEALEVGDRLIFDLSAADPVCFKPERTFTLLYDLRKKKPAARIELILGEHHRDAINTDQLADYLSCTVSFKKAPVLPVTDKYEDSLSPATSVRTPPVLPNKVADPRQRDDTEPGNKAADWSDDKNNRRCDLIDKEIAGMLSPSEEQELAGLQQQMIDYRNRVAPLPLDELRELHSELLRLAQEDDKRQQ